MTCLPQILKQKQNFIMIKSVSAGAFQSKGLLKIWMKKIWIDSKMQILAQTGITWEKRLSAITSRFWEKWVWSLETLTSTLFAKDHNTFVIKCDLSSPVESSTGHLWKKQKWLKSGLIKFLYKVGIFLLKAILKFSLFFLIKVRKIFFRSGQTYVDGPVFDV